MCDLFTNENVSMDPPTTQQIFKKYTGLVLEHLPNKPLLDYFMFVGKVMPFSEKIAKFYFMQLLEGIQ